MTDSDDMLERRLRDEAPRGPLAGDAVRRRVLAAAIDGAARRQRAARRTGAAVAVLVAVVPCLVVVRLAARPGGEAATAMVEPGRPTRTPAEPVAFPHGAGPGLAAVLRLPVRAPIMVRDWLAGNVERASGGLLTVAGASPKPAARPAARSHDPRHIAAAISRPDEIPLLLVKLSRAEIDARLRGPPTRHPRTAHRSRPWSIVIQAAGAVLVGGAGGARADGPADAADRQLVRQFVTEAERLVRERDTFQGAPSVAAVLAELGDTEPAVAILELVRGRKGLDFDVALRRLAAGHARHGDLEAARRAIAGIRDAEDGSARQRPLAWIEVGEALAARGDREDARQAFDEAFAEAVAEIESGKVYSSEIDLLGRIGTGRWANGDEDASARAFAKALDYAPKAGSLAAVCQREIAARQAQIGKVAVARDTLGQITDPSDRDSARRHVAKTLFAAGERAEAQRLIEEVVTPRQARSGALEFAEWLVRAGEPAAANPWIARAERAWTEVADPGERIGLAFRLCSARAATGERDSAREWLERAAAHAAKRSDEELGRGPPGAPRMLEPMRRDGLREATLREIAELQSQLGLVAEARRSFGRALAAARGREDEIWRKVAVWAVVDSQAKAGLPDDALETMMALPREDRDWPKLAKIGGALAKAGRLPEAIALCDRYQGHQELAETLLDMGKAETALAVALRQQGGSGIYPLEKIARTLAAERREQVVVDSLRGEMHDNQRLVILEGTMEGLLERSRDAEPAAPAARGRGPIAEALP